MEEKPQMEDKQPDYEVSSFSNSVRVQSQNNSVSLSQNKSDMDTPFTKKKRDLKEKLLASVRKSSS